MHCLYKTFRTYLLLRQVYNLKAGLLFSYQKASGVLKTSYKTILKALGIFGGLKELISLIQMSSFLPSFNSVYLSKCSPGGIETLPLPPAILV